MPEELFQPSFINGKQFLACPICTMVAVNVTHGQAIGTPFGGQKAQELVEEAWQYFDPKEEDTWGFLGENKNVHPVYKFS